MVIDSIESRIMALKKQRNAVILVHNYQIPEVQNIADYIGDSLELSRLAADTEAEVIVFCGVHFMAETASILSPQKTVLIPDKDAGCPMADMITVEQLNGLKEAYPDAVVICYVNSSADVKAASDYCCTSANAVDIVRAVPEDRDIIFVPDKYLGRYVAAETGRDIVLWNGYCPTHVRITESDIVRQKEAHPDALVMVHPECSGPVCALADEILSTGGMCRIAGSAEVEEFIVGTEIGIVY
ncbi:MAG: quinolinate synthase NadA, partial [Candidatus Hydrogenedentes bacterium]|nr:quinolinate synthase NadA [Candidatus Hydrogenedentota bacterium]